MTRAANQKWSQLGAFCSRARSTTRAARCRPSPFEVEAISVGQDPKTGEVITAPHVVWDEEPVDITADQAVAAAAAGGKERGGRSSEALDGAMKFLAEILKNGPVLSKHVYEEGEQRGFSEDQLKRAGKKLGIAAQNPNKKGFEPWQWTLPGL